MEYTYDAWGNLLGTTGSLANTLGADNLLRYRGYVYDTETELYYLQSRYYDPQLGRFRPADSTKILNAPMNIPAPSYGVSGYLCSYMQYL